MIKLLPPTDVPYWRVEVLETGVLYLVTCPDGSSYEVSVTWLQSNLSKFKFDALLVVRYIDNFKAVRINLVDKLYGLVTPNEGAVW